MANDNYWIDGDDDLLDGVDDLLDGDMLGCIDGVDIGSDCDMENELAGFSLSDLNPMKHVAKAVNAVIPGAGKFVDPIGNVVDAVVDSGGRAVLGTSTGLRKGKRKRKRGRTGFGALTRTVRKARSRAGKPTKKKRRRSSRASGNALEVMARALASQNAISAMARTPKVRAKKVSTGTAGRGNAQLANLVAVSVAKKLGPDISAVNRKLRLAANQRTATSEHLTINNKTAFRRKVLQDLLRISTTLPQGHPTRDRIRKVGLFSGLL